KVILETGELETLDNIRRASDLAIAAGADFIKTSTGKVQPAATLPVTLIMLEAIRDCFLRTGRIVGMKPAGGIRTAKQALLYLANCNFNSGTGLSTISNWLIIPQVLLHNGDTLRFWTRTTDGSFPDRLQLRMSTAGSSTNTGAGPLAVGDFTTLLVDINPSYT